MGSGGNLNTRQQMQQLHAEQQTAGLLCAAGQPSSASRTETETYDGTNLVLNKMI